MAEMKKPKSGGTPRSINDKLKDRGYGPGGPQTPGAKAKRAKLKRSENRQGKLSK